MDEFTKALNDEFDLTPDEEPTTVAVEEPPVVEEPKVEEPAPTVEEPVAEAPTTEEAPVEEPTVETPQYATKDDVKSALRELSTETNERVEMVNSTVEEVISSVYPEGIDTNLYDSNGNVIKTAQDIVDRGLLNDRTGEPFTYEEAASWMMGAQQKMNQNLSELKDWAEDIAEKNISLVDSNTRVMEQWGDTLKADPKLAKELAEEYIATQLKFDKTHSYITEMNMSPETYYNRVLAPYKELQAARAAQAELEAAQAQRQAQAEQAERTGLPPQRGQSRTKSNTGDKFLDALIDEMEKE